MHLWSLLKLLLVHSRAQAHTLTLTSRSLLKSMTTTIPMHPKKTATNLPLIWTSPRIGTSSSKMSKLLRSKATVRVGGRRQILSDEDDFVGSAAESKNLSEAEKAAEHTKIPGINSQFWQMIEECCSSEILLDSYLRWKFWSIKQIHVFQMIDWVDAMVRISSIEHDNNWVGVFCVSKAHLNCFSEDNLTFHVLFEIIIKKKYLPCIQE